MYEVRSKRDDTKRTNPPKILTEKLVIKTFIFGTALPSTAKETLTRKLSAMKGAAIRVPITNTLETSSTNAHRVGGKEKNSRSVKYQNS